MTRANEEIKSESERLRCESEATKAMYTELQSRHTNLEKENDDLYQEAKTMKTENEALSRELVRMQQSARESKNHLQEHLRNTSAMLEDVYRKEISGKSGYRGMMHEMVTKMRRNRTEFLEELEAHLDVAYPNFMKYVNGLVLSAEEKDFVMLYAIGLTGADIERYMEKKYPYKISSALRKKLEVGDDDHNITTFILNLKARLDGI